MAWPALTRHSREGGNPDLYLAAIGSTAGFTAKRRPFVISVTIQLQSY